MSEQKQVISDAMLKRDNYFHICWMELKHRCPDLWKAMSEVELTVSGYSSSGDKDEPESDVNVL
jgi:hypothetical protein